jgi:hypothetical protein
MKQIIILADPDTRVQHHAQHKEHCAYCDEYRTAQQRINDKIGLITHYDENGLFSHIEETEAHKGFSKLLNDRDREARRGKHTSIYG